ncbi:MAG TPA: hypothetical protein ENN03_09295 [bacterium]|nr:hypothetical protein [bacterium]
MPGFHFVHCHQSGFSRKLEERALRGCLHSDDYEVRCLAKTNTARLFVSAYNGYPVRSWEDDRVRVYMEGHVYGLTESDLREQILRLARDVLSGTPSGRLERWLRGTDGEFLLIIHDKKNLSWFVLNDALAHLPVYYYATADRMILSREMGFLLSCEPDTDMDPLSAALYALFIFTPGTRTLFRNIRRMAPGSLIRVDPGGRWRFQRVVEWNFETSAEYRMDWIDQLTGLFRETCDAMRNISSGGRRIISLSGGIDSRAVIAGLLPDPQLHSETFLDKEKTAVRDVRVASRVARWAGSPWSLTPLSPVRAEDLNKLMDLKKGMCSFGMGFILSFFQSIRERYGSKVLFFTGNTGMLLRHYGLPADIDDSAKLSEYILSRHHQLPMDMVAAWTGISPAAVREKLTEIVDRYPENSLEGKYLHFIMTGKGMIWHYENADLARYYFWPCAPLESTRFYQMASRIPQSMKKDYQLYRCFIGHLNPDAGRIPDANTGLAFSAALFPLIYGAEQRMVSALSRYSRLMLKARRLWTHKGRSRVESEARKCMEEQLKSMITHSGSVEVLGRFLRGGGGISKFQIELLLTLASVREMIEGRPISLERYFGREMH